MSIIRRDIGARPASRLKSKLSVVRAGRAVPDVRLELRTGGEFSLFSRVPEGLEATMDRLAARAAEPNVFHSAAVIATALGHVPGLRLALLGMEPSKGTAELDAALAFRVERQGNELVAAAFGMPEISYAAPLVSRNRPMAVLDQLFEALAGDLSNLPPVLVFADLVSDGPFMRMARAAAAARGLFFRVAGARRHKILAEGGLQKPSLDPEQRRQWQSVIDKWAALARLYDLEFRVARNLGEVEAALADLAPLRSRAGSSLDATLVAPIVRALATRDQIRLFTLRHGETVVAAVLQPVLAGEAWLWQVLVHPDFAETALDEQLLVRISEWNGSDPNIAVTRTAATAPAFLAQSVWGTDETRATLVLGLNAGAGRAVEAVARFHDERQSD